MSATSPLLAGVLGLALLLGGAGNALAQNRPSIGVPVPPAVVPGPPGVGPRPSGDDPAALAAWRIRSFEASIASALSSLETVQRGAESNRNTILRMDEGTSETQRLYNLNRAEYWRQRSDMLELRLDALTRARDAAVLAEAVRLEAEAGRRSPAEVAAAEAEVAAAERRITLLNRAENSLTTLDRIVSEPIEARMDAERGLTQERMAEQSRSLAETLAAQAAARPNDPEIQRLARTAAERLRASEEREALVREYDAADAVASAALEKSRQASERARLEGVGYAILRDAVDAGEWSADALGAAELRLKRAQEAMYDAREEARLAQNTRSEILYRRMVHTRNESERAQREQSERLASLEAQLNTRLASPQTANTELTRNLRAQVDQLRQMTAVRGAPAAPPVLNQLPPTQRPVLPVLPPRVNDIALNQ